MSTHIGKDFTPPCVPGKVTGEIKYAEDYNAEGMVFARLLTSPSLLLFPSNVLCHLLLQLDLRGLMGKVGKFRMTQKMRMRCKREPVLSPRVGALKHPRSPVQRRRAHHGIVTRGHVVLKRLRKVHALPLRLDFLLSNILAKPSLAYLRRGHIARHQGTERVRIPSHCLQVALLTCGVNGRFESAA